MESCDACSVPSVHETSRRCWTRHASGLWWTDAGKEVDCMYRKKRIKACLTI